MQDIILEIPVSEHFVLSAGGVVAEGNLRIIYPPEESLVDQLCAWLHQCPAPTVGFNHWVFAIGATALCLRWGTYLAVLMDETKPIDPRTNRQTTSMISQDEMKRINIEASSNLAHLLQLWHEDEAAYFDLLRRAYEWLPMPQQRVKRTLGPLESLLGFLIGVQEMSSVNELTAVPHPYRTVANTIINLVYRNGPIEEIHAGRGHTFSLDHRRFTARQARSIIRHSAESLNPFVTDFPLWNNRLMRLPPWPKSVARLSSYLWYPGVWSLTETSSEIQFRTSINEAGE